MSKNNKSFELFIKSSSKINKSKNKNFNLSDSITSVENLSDTSISEQSQVIINDISTHLKQKLTNMQ